MASRKINSNRKAGFFWQGLLILLPVLVLAGFGLFFLRQDKIAAENEAKERAQATVDDLLADISGDQFLANLLEIYFSAETMRGKTGNSVPAWFPKIGAEANVIAPMRDEIFNTWPSAAGGEVWGGVPMDLDENGQARWLGSGKAKRPVNYTHTLEPMPLDLGRLSAEQGKSWDKAQQAEFSGTDGTKAIEAYQNFLKDSPPVRFQQAAEYTLALLQARKGLVEPAITSLAKLQNADGAFT
jgi:choline dehydrogenase-like flavoprotein